MTVTRAKEQAPMATLVFLMVVQLVTVVYFYGRLTERVESIDRTTQILLQRQLNATSVSLNGAVSR